MNTTSFLKSMVNNVRNSELAIRNLISLKVINTASFPKSMVNNVRNFEFTISNLLTPT